MKTIWKYTLMVKDLQTIEMPVNATILSVQTQNDVICIWVLVTLNHITEMRHFVIIGTGHPVSENYKMTFIGTVQMNSGQLVWHVFELAK